MEVSITKEFLVQIRYLKALKFSLVWETSEHVYITWFGSSLSTSLSGRVGNDRDLKSRGRGFESCLVPDFYFYFFFKSFFKKNLLFILNYVFSFLIIFVLFLYNTKIIKIDKMLNIVLFSANVPVFTLTIWFVIYNFTILKIPHYRGWAFSMADAIFSCGQGRLTNYGGLWY